MGQFTKRNTIYKHENVSNLDNYGIDFYAFLWPVLNVLKKLIKSEEAVPSLTAIGTLIKSINPGWAVWAKMGMILPTRDTKPSNRLMVTSSSYFGGGATPGCSS